MMQILKSLLILIPFALVTVATSVGPKESFTLPKSFSYTSNCGNATTTTGQISTFGDAIDTPVGLTFLNLGFPVANMTVGQNVSGDLAPALNRVCNNSDSVISGVTTSTYSCADNGLAACIITLTHL
jgi:hypothetical protein